VKPRRSSNDTATNDGPTPETFIVTKEYRRFAEFCDACRRYRYIGLCYGSPGVGKTLSARRYADWDRIEAHTPVRDADTAALQALLDSQTVFYTPPVVNSPGQIERAINYLRHSLRSILLEERERKQRIHLDKIREEETAEQKEWTAEQEEWQEDLLTKIDWINGPIPLKQPSQYALLSREYDRKNSQIADPTTLVIIDEADRLKMTALEQVRDIFDKGDIGVILIGMPGIEKRLARYPQLYSRVGFVHAFRPLTAAEVSDVLLQQNWRPAGVSFAEEAIEDKEALAAIIRITGGNFRLLHRLIAQTARIMEINELATITTQVVEAARESLVIGTT
jgi:DNA transposition AAA+ family ATPase